MLSKTAAPVKVDDPMTDKLSFKVAAPSTVSMPKAYNPESVEAPVTARAEDRLVLPVIQGILRVAEPLT